MVLTNANPVFSALSLAFTMVGISALFVTLDAYFIAGVQLIVYAGAVMVLFTMVIMLFDLKAEARAFSRGVISGGIKLVSAGVFTGIVAGTLLTTIDSSSAAKSTQVQTVKQLSTLLFTKYIFVFEALGILLLVVAIGAVALSRARGGTHAK